MGYKFNYLDEINAARAYYWNRRDILLSAVVIVVPVPRRYDVPDPAPWPTDGGQWFEPVERWRVIVEHLSSQCRPGPVVGQYEHLALCWWRVFQQMRLKYLHNAANKQQQIKLLWSATANYSTSSDLTSKDIMPSVGVPRLFSTNLVCILKFLFV